MNLGCSNVGPFSSILASSLGRENFIYFCWLNHRLLRFTGLDFLVYIRDDHHL